MKRKSLLKIVISLALFGVVLWRSDTDAVFANFSLIKIAYIPSIILLLVLNYVVSSMRWRALLIRGNGDKVSIGYLTSLYFVGAFFNNFLPTSIGGDGYKVYKLGQKIGSTTDAFSATFMERFTGVLALTLISLVSLVQILGLLGVVLFAGFWTAAALGFYALRVLSYRSFSNSKLARLGGILKNIYESLTAYRHEKRALLLAIMTSFVVQLLAVFTQYFVFKSIGITLPVIYSMFAFPFIFLVGYAVPSVNGLGVQDALYIQLFGVLGVSAEAAVSASILYHLFRLVVSLAGGVLYALGKAD
ncbi:flippase-like domain-containing protein [candidate division WWE3 bacterium]|nr:flippase-like domain-containing protein [candidate division WWE3 bacterium]